MVSAAVFLEGDEVQVCKSWKGPSQVRLMIKFFDFFIGVVWAFFQVEHRKNEKSMFIISLKISLFCWHFIYIQTDDYSMPLATKGCDCDNLS